MNYENEVLCKKILFYFYVFGFCASLYIKKDFLKINQ